MKIQSAYKFLQHLFRRTQNPPRLIEYLILDGNCTIATLTHPWQEDMFWFSFLLTPKTDDEQALTRLYCSAFWLSDQMHFIDAHTGKEVTFLLAWLDEEDENEEEPRDYMEERPARVKLRGPYPQSKH